MVHPDHRSCGVGSLLLEAAENVARQRGYERAGLWVALENVRARALYARRGYQDCGRGEHPTTWSYIDAKGEEHVYAEVQVYMIKRLSEKLERVEEQE